MRHTAFFISLLIGSLLFSGSAHAEVDWIRVIWDGDASSEATISFSSGIAPMPPLAIKPFVEYGTSTSKRNWSAREPYNVSVKGTLYHHHVHLSNLPANSPVYFRVCDYGGWFGSKVCSAKYWFKTAPNDNSPFLFIAGGDSRADTLGQGRSDRQAANRLVSKVRPLFVMFGGDYTNLNTMVEWRDWLDDWELTYSHDTIDGKSFTRVYPMIATHGNHEDTDFHTICKVLGTDPDKDGHCESSDTYYSVDVSPLLRAYTLNTQLLLSSSQTSQNNWLRSDLQNYGGNHTWRMAQYHLPMFPHSDAKEDDPVIYDWWAKLFFDYSMNVVMESDTHIAKLTEALMPSNNTFVGLRDGITSGTVYAGEGSWGAPTRPANKPKSWTIDLESFPQFKIITVDQNTMTMRTARFGGSPQALSWADRVNNPTAIPGGIDFWNANRIGQVLQIKRDVDGRSEIIGLEAAY